MGSPDRSSRSAQIENVPFVRQSAGHCGPASLAMVMQWNGRPISADALASQVYTPGANGSFQADLITASRRHSMMAVPIEGMQSLLTELDAGHPVIIFENLGLSWAPQYHYAVVYGYDLSHEEILMHSGPEAGKRWDLRKFERSWKLTDYWGLVVLPPGKISASASELAHLNAATGLEQSGFGEAAAESYRAIRGRWPQSLGAMIGLANVAYAKGEMKTAVFYLRQAIQVHPDSAPAWHNLAIAEKAAGFERAARGSAKQALKLVASELQPVYTADFSEIL